MTDSTSLPKKRKPQTFLDPFLILDYIADKNWSDKEAAEHLNIARTSINKWRNAGVGVTYWAYDRVAVHLGHVPETLWGLDWETRVTREKVSK